MSLGSDSSLNELIHPGLLSAIERAYPSIVDVQVKTVVISQDGEEVLTWANHVTMINIPGILAKSGAVGQERRRVDLTIARSTLILDLASYYPDIDINDHRVYIITPQDGRIETFNILQVLHDSQTKTTRLELEDVEH